MLKQHLRVTDRDVTGLSHRCYPGLKPAVTKR